MIKRAAAVLRLFCLEGEVAMPYYELFAAHDGDTLRDYALCADRDAAEAWARDRIVGTFEFHHLRNREYTEVAAETDGVSLFAVPPDPVGLFLQDWLMSQAQMIDPFISHFRGKFAAEFRSYRGGVLDLVLALQREQRG